MKAIHWETMQLITQELANLPHEYASNNFASEAEGIAVIREEYLELENEVFWGKKKAANTREWKNKMKAEAVQLACMAIRLIQECCGLTIHDLEVGNKYEISFDRHGIIGTQVFEVTKITDYTLFAMPFDLNHYEVTFIKEI